MSVKNKYKAIVFDMDGTLIDTDEMLFSIIKNLFARYRPEYRFSQEDLMSFSGPPLQESFAVYFPHVPLDRIIDEYRSEAFRIMNSAVRCYPGTKETLRKIKSAGFLIGIDTNKQSSSTHKTLKMLRIDHLFDCVVGYDDVSFPKPYPDGLRKCLDILKISADECLFVGDTFYDYEAARQAGVDFALAGWSGRKATDRMRPTYVVGSYGELLEVIKHE